MELKVRRFTTQAVGIIRLIPGDVGRPITDVTSDLRYAELEDDAKGVLRSLAPVVREVVAHDGRWFSARIRPYQTVDNRIDGVVLTFTDISKGKATEAELRDVQKGLEGRLAEHSGQGEDDR
jgi:two-component system CheB/CheR fusion protein